MNLEPVKPDQLAAAGSCLRVYLLGEMEFTAVQHLQRRLVYQVQEERECGALVLCEHAPSITVGRQGRPGEVQFESEELRARRWPIQWVNRGGGCWLHLHGQLACYAVVALDRIGLGVQTYVSGLHDVVVGLLQEFRIPAVIRPGHSGVWVGSRLIADVGVAVRDWVSYYGLILNVNPDLVPYRNIHSGGDGPMTSLERERRGRLSPALVRELFLEHFRAVFTFERTALFFNQEAGVHSIPSTTLRKTSRFQSA